MMSCEMATDCTLPPLCCSFLFDPQAQAVETLVRSTVRLSYSRRCTEQPRQRNVRVFFFRSTRVSPREPNVSGLIYAFYPLSPPFNGVVVCRRSLVSSPLPLSFAPTVVASGHSQDSMHRRIRLATHFHSSRRGPKLGVAVSNDPPLDLWLFSTLHATLHAIYKAVLRQGFTSTTAKHTPDGSAGRSFAVIRRYYCSFTTFTMRQKAGLPSKTGPIGG